jgi:erythritol transport system permease protein
MTATTPTRKRVDVRALLIEGRAFIALLAIIVIFTALSSSYFTPTNIVSMTSHVAINAILAIGMLVVILSGGIDLSVGATMGMSGMVAGLLLNGVKLPGGGTTLYPAVWLVILIACAVGTFIGFVNGFVITRFRVPPFIMTLGMTYAVSGAALLLNNGTTFPNLTGSPIAHNQGFGVLGDTLVGLPTGIWIMIVLTVLAYLLLRRARFGRWLYAAGGNPRAAELSGVPVRSVTTRIYMIAGFCAAVAGLVATAQLTSAAPQTGTGYELNAIAAVVIGGAALSGGRGRVRGTLVGAFVIGFLADGLVIVGVSTFWQQVIQGVVIVVAVAVDQAQRRVRRVRSSQAGTTTGTPTSGGSTPGEGPQTPDGADADRSANTRKVTAQ